MYPTTHLNIRSPHLSPIWDHSHSTYAQRVWGGEGSTQMPTIAYKEGGGFQVAYVQKKFFLDNKISKLLFFCKKEAIILSFIIVYRKM